MRFAPAGLRRLAKSAGAWCKTKGCGGLAPERLRALDARDVPSATIRQAERLIERTLASKLAQRPPTRSASSITVLTSGREEHLIALAVELPEDPSQARHGPLPHHAHFLVAQVGDGLRQLLTVGAYTEGLGDTGELLGAIDLDGDGTDELLLEYDGGTSHRLVQRRGERLIVLGQFGSGC